MLHIEDNRTSGTEWKSSLTMDYSIINPDSDTLLSFDLELNLSEFDMLGVGTFDNHEDNLIDDKVNPWSELQSNSLDMNAGFDLSYAVMVNPRSVMADMSNHGSISRNRILETQNGTSVNEMEHMSDRTETPESLNWSIHQEQNASESESDDYYDGTESEEEENEKQVDFKEEENLDDQFAGNDSNSTAHISEDTIQPLSTQLTANQQHSPKLQHIKINNGGLQKVKIVPNSGQAQQLRRQICNSNMQARLLAQQQSQVLQPTASIKIEVQDYIEKKEENYNGTDEIKCYPKPTYSYSCLIAMALKNSQTGLLPVSEIYKFMCDHFPYFKTAPSGWKNSVRHNLSLNKCFEKVEKADTGGNQRKGCLWAINSSRKQKMDEEMKKWSTKDRALILSSLLNPDFLEPLENGELKHLYQNTSEQMLSISEAESTSTDELGSSVCSGAQSPYHQSSNQLATTNSVSDSLDESSRDGEIELSQKMYVEDNAEDPLQLPLTVPSQKNISIFEINQIKDSPIFEISEPSDSPVYELNHPQDSPVYHFELQNDSPIDQTDQQSKIHPVYQFKQVNSNSNSCNSWSNSSNSNSNISNNGGCSPNRQDNQANNSEYQSNQRSNKRQKSFVSVTNRTDYNTQSVIEVRRKVAVSRTKNVTSGSQF